LVKEVIIGISCLYVVVVAYQIFLLLHWWLKSSSW
jgi:hypothetical protein